MQGRERLRAMERNGEEGRGRERKGEEGSWEGRGGGGDKVRYRKR